jgi:hypothetical protein
MQDISVRRRTQGQLLQHLGRMKYLTHLSLCCSLFGFTEEVPVPALASITASSSSLQHLNLAECSLPEGAWGSIFSEGAGQLMALTHLNLEAAAPDLNACDIERLVQACLNLRSQSVSVRYKETPRGPANPMLTPGPNPCPAFETQGATHLPQVSPTTCSTQAELASNMYKA